MFETVGLIVSAARLAEPWLKKAERADEDQREYREKLEHASPDDVFRYVFLINNAAVQQYVSQSRGQAEASFVLSRRAAIAGFGLLLIGIVIGLVGEPTEHSLDITLLAGVGGAITQFIAGVFLALAGLCRGGRPDFHQRRGVGKGAERWPGAA